MLVTHPSPSGSYTLLSPGATHLPLDSHPHTLALQILFPRTQGQVVLLGTATGVPQRGTESERRRGGGIHTSFPGAVKFPQLQTPGSNYQLLLHSAAALPHFSVVLADLPPLGRQHP